MVRSQPKQLLQGNSEIQHWASILHSELALLEAGEVLPKDDWADKQEWAVLQEGCDSDKVIRLKTEEGVLWQGAEVGHAGAGVNESQGYAVHWPLGYWDLEELWGKIEGEKPAYEDAGWGHDEGQWKKILTGGFVCQDHRSRKTAHRRVCQQCVLLMKQIWIYQWFLYCSIV